MADNDFLDLEGKEEKKEELILGKFKTSNELEKAYSELESKFTQTAQEAAATKKTVEELQAKIQTVQVEARPEEEDDENLIFTNPKLAIEKAVQKAIEPFVRGSAESNIENFCSLHPEFEPYKEKVKEFVKQNPNAAKQPGEIGQLFKAVRGLEFDPVAFEKEVREKLKKESQDKVNGSLAEGDAGGLPENNSKKITLSEEEKRVARKFNPGLSPEKAYERYVGLKTKHGGGR